MKPYYEHAGIVIYRGDCREVLPHLEQCDLVLTDPPYSETTHEGARTGDREACGKLVDFSPVSAEYLRNCFGDIGVRRWLISFMDWKHLTELEREPPQGLRFVRFGVWVKPNSTPQFTGDRPSMGWEAIALFEKDPVLLDTELSYSVEGRWDRGEWEEAMTLGVRTCAW